jgi:putative membrane protein
MKAVVALLCLAAAGVTSCDDDNNLNCPDGGRAGAGAGSGGGGGGGGGGSDGGAGTSGGGGTGADAAADAGDAGTDADAGPVVLNDGQIAGVMIEANAGEVHAGDIALGRTKTAPVRAFANMMITDHTMANRSLDMLLDAQNLLASDSPVRRTLGMQAVQALNNLWAASPTAFDAAYADSQVMMHMMVLSLLDTTLIPQAQNAALKAALMTARTTVAGHLAAAQALKASLSADGGADGATDGTADGVEAGDAAATEAGDAAADGAADGG